MTTLRKSAVLEIVLISVTCLSGAGAARTWLRPIDANAGVPTWPSIARSATLAEKQDPDEVLAMSADVVERDPFRLERRPSGVPFQLSAGENVVAPPAPPRPQLAVSGIVGGPPWIAILTGIPERDGAVVVRTGDSFADLAVRSISRQAVVISAPDTVWRLVVRRP